MELQTFIRGVVVGAVLGILFAPDSGKATRQKIAQKASDLKDSMGEACDQFAGEMSQQINKVKGKAKDIIDKGKRTINDLKDSASEAV